MIGMGNDLVGMGRVFIKLALSTYFYAIQSVGADDLSLALFRTPPKAISVMRGISISN
jgi:hypothetical protein